MNIDFESEMLMFCLKSYDGHSTWIEEIEHDDDFTEEELKEIEEKFNEGING